MPDEPQDPQTEPVTTPPVTEPQVTPEPPVEEPFDKERAMATIQKLRDIEKQHKQDRKELERLQAEEKQRADASLSETEREKKRADEAEARALKLETETNQTKAALKAGLPSEWADRLKGKTYDEMLADAQELAKTLPQLKVAPKVPPTNPANGQTTDKTQETRAWLNGSHGNPFDLNNVQQKGGGVVGKQ